jgi:hypothetical protein
MQISANPPVPVAQPRRSGGNGCLWIGLNGMFLIFLVIGGWYGWRSWNLVRFGGIVTGTVVRVDFDSDEDGDSYAPIVHYAVDGRSYEMTGTYTNPPAYDVGDQVQLRYDQDDPSIARIDSFWDLWLLPLIFIPMAALVGGIFNIVMVVQWVRGRQAVALS